MKKRQNDRTTDQIFLYWDDLSDLTQLGIKMANSRDEVYDSEMAGRREDTLLHMEGKRIKRPKTKRVDELYQKYLKLSRIEQTNFINLLKNHY